MLSFMKRFQKRQVASGEDGLVERLRGRNTAIQWSEVTAIRGVKLDLITYQENFLVIDGTNQAISIGELDDEFDAIDSEVRRRFPAVPEGWRTRLEEGADEVILWTRDD